MKNRSDVFITAAVFACSAILVGALLFAVVGNPWQRPHLTFTADFADVTGLQVNSEVVYAGAPVGKVVGVTYLEPDERLRPEAIVRLDLAILDPVPIPKHVRVQISSESMLSDRHVALTRVDEEGGLLADGDRLVAAPAGSMLEQMVPGASQILANVDETIRNLKSISERLDTGEDGRNLSAMISTLHDTAASLQLAFEGDGEEVKGVKPQALEISADLQAVASNLRLTIEGNGSEENPGMSQRTDEIFANLEVFTDELSSFLVGSDGEPGVRSQIASIVDEMERLLKGGEDEEGFRVQLAAVMEQADNLMLEMQTLMIWGQYFTGALAEKPNRLVFSGKSDGIPTKEQILEHLQNSGEPFPVRIQANESEDDERRFSSRFDRNRTTR